MPKKTKKQKKKIAAQEIKLQQDRLNVVLPPLLNFLATDVGQTILWWQISNHVKVLDAANKVIVGKELVEALAGFVPGSNVEFMDIPKTIQMGALLQELQDATEAIPPSVGPPPELIPAAAEEAQGTAIEIITGVVAIVLAPLFSLGNPFSNTTSTAPPPATDPETGEILPGQEFPITPGTGII